MFRRKAEGIDDAAARTATCPPSDLTITGLVRHMAEVERSWFRRGIAGENAAPIYYSDDDPDGDFHSVPPTRSTRRSPPGNARSSSPRRSWRRPALDDLDRLREQYSVRWILVHMIEEYARHCGHLDLIREAIDGVRRRLAQSVVPGRRSTSRSGSPL